MLITYCITCLRKLKHSFWKNFWNNYKSSPMIKNVMNIRPNIKISGDIQLLLILLKNVKVRFLKIMFNWICQRRWTILERYPKHSFFVQRNQEISWYKSDLRSLSVVILYSLSIFNLKILRQWLKISKRKILMVQLWQASVLINYACVHEW